MTFKPGDKAKVIGNRNFHRCKIGEIVTINEYDVSGNDYNIRDSKGKYWWILACDLEPASKVDTVGEEAERLQEEMHKAVEMIMDKTTVSYQDAVNTFLLSTISQLRAELEQLKKVK